MEEPSQVSATPEAAAKGQPERGPWWRPRPLAFGGIIGALILTWASLTPTLLPRSAMFQGLITGAAAAIGYGAGVLVVALALWSVHREPGRTPRVWWLTLSALAVVGTAVMFIWFAQWQHDLRTLMGVDDLGVGAYPTMIVIAVVEFFVIVAIARGWSAAATWTGRQLGRIVPPRLALLMAGAVVIALTIGIINGVVVRGVMSALNGTFRAINNELDPDTPASTIAERSGGPGSLVTWESLGRQGRTFMANGPTVEELSEFNDRPAKQPIRAYTGLASAETPEDEAELAVAELDRMGAFDRAVVAVGCRRVFGEAGGI